MKAEVDIKPFLKAINEFRIAEQQPCGVQVVEWFGLVVLFRAVFAEEVGDFIGSFQLDCCPFGIN